MEKFQRQSQRRSRCTVHSIAVFAVFSVLGVYLQRPFKWQNVITLWIDRCLNPPTILLVVLAIENEVFCCTHNWEWKLKPFKTIFLLFASRCYIATWQEVDFNLPHCDLWGYVWFKGHCHGRSQWKLRERNTGNYLRYCYPALIISLAVLRGVRGFNTKRTK